MVDTDSGAGAGRDAERSLHEFYALGLNIACGCRHNSRPCSSIAALSSVGKDGVQHQHEESTAFKIDLPYFPS